MIKTKDMNSNPLNITVVSSAAVDERPVAIYVHGLASGAAGTTFGSLSRKFKQYRWITTDFGEDILVNKLILEYMISQHNPSLVVGTSMGGLTVLYADAPNVVKIVCNPALSIADCVRNTIGLGKHSYFCERLNGATEFELTEQMCQRYERYIASHTPSLGRANYAIFSPHDELLGDEASAAVQQVVANSGYRVLIDPEGKHRMQSSTIDLIAKEIVDNEYFWGISLRNSEQLNEK